MAAITESSKKMLTLRSSDDQVFEIEESVAMESQTIRHLIEDGCADNSIPLPNVDGRILSMVIEYCKKHADSNAADDELNAWDADFVKVDHITLFDIVLAANYLDIKSLLEFTCQATADLIKPMSVEEVRTMFNIKNDWTTEEEENIRRENQWAFQDGV